MDLRSHAPLDVDHAAIDVFESMAEVARDGLKSRTAQMLEMLGLVLGNARLSPADYYRYRLYDDRRLTREDKRRFIGNNRYWTTTLRVSDSRWCALTDDKLVTARMLASSDIAVPEIQGLYHPYRHHAGAVAMRSPADLRQFLEREARYPLFGKPVSGFESKGAVYLRCFDSERDELEMYDRSRVSLDEFAAAVDQFVNEPLPGFRRFRNQLGYLFQGVIRQHPDITRVAGTTVASMRPFVVLEDEGPRILALTWKVPAPGNFADNSLHRGNMLAAVDVDSGRVTRVVRGEGTRQEEMEANPYTGETLLGFQIPHFERFRDTVFEGARLMPGIRIQGWDVAIGPDGPIVIEVNNGSSYTAPQLSSGKGFLQPDYLRFLERAEAENETWPWKDFFYRQEHGHRFGRSRGVLRVLRQASGALGAGQRAKRAR